ncbi:ABC transporter substrate-binding protein [Aureimonas phyllosphaerae]|uniref:Trehalose/maltose transport system substrate-binding protein n=1 Tax=Aureimonas phyllosphaerae TaxID=1166078 RepID=A0A7W6BXR4_9HYPH|nr:ABC transporter substrate-binding protein [Aureimonas phyllosphaerae]MBB3934677.1 trehalose/maltose transport system substrate-binding protein [Aureimonas phyllosphaerae]MBB3958107.1 trehalose/maltose transport system substrate-binding protein [Aureimonas phyllosphaerae]SFE91931.1 trehalose/maltose transport system substrate-binding protein [Aureimonas phyllosphaerae]
MPKVLTAALLAATILSVGSARAEEISIALGSVGRDVDEMRGQLDAFQKATGHTVKIVTMPASTTDQFGQYRLWLSAGNKDVDVYRTDVIWAPQLAANLVDLTDAMKDVVGQHLPAVIQSQTVEGKLVAMPLFADAPALYYRKDLLEKHGREVPKTWAELTETAKVVQDAERQGGNAQMNGFVFQGAAYEGLTCDALEWIASNGGGQIVSPEGEITINNGKAAAALDLAKGWVGTIAPQGVLGYMEEESRGVWQTGNAVFMRNWPYAYPLSAADDSPVKGKFDAVPLPAGEGGQSAACLGGWNLAVSQYSEHQDVAIELVKFLTSAESQKSRALGTARLPTIPSLYEDPEIAEKQPLVAKWKTVFENATPRPSAPTKAKYNEVSQQFWTAVNKTLAGQGDAATNLQDLERQLRRLKRNAW